MNSLRFLPALLVVSSLAAQVPSQAQSSNNAAPVSYASMSQVNAMLGNLEQTAQNSVADLNRLRVEKWKTDGNTKRQEQSDVESLQRNLQNALPGLVNELRNAPENMAATCSPMTNAAPITAATICAISRVRFAPLVRNKAIDRANAAAVAIAPSAMTTP